MSMSAEVEHAAGKVREAFGKLPAEGAAGAVREAMDKACKHLGYALVAEPHSTDEAESAGAARTWAHAALARFGYPVNEDIARANAGHEDEYA